MQTKFHPPRFQAVTANGDPIIGSIEFYLTGTSTKITTYSDATRLSANSNPINANSLGMFGPIFFDPADLDVGVKVAFYDAANGATGSGTIVYTDDPYDFNEPLTWDDLSSILTQSQIGSVFYPRTSQETAAGIQAYAPSNSMGDIVNPYKPPGDVLRYGTNTTPGTTNMYEALAAAIAQNEQTGGAPIKTHSDTYYTGTGLVWLSAGQDNKTWLASNTIITVDSDIIGLTVGPIDDDIWSVNPQILGHLDVINSSGSASSTKEGIRFQQTYEGEFHFSVEGFAYGYRQATTHTNAGYNEFFPVRVSNNTTGFAYDIDNTDGGVVNQNNHHGGRYRTSGTGDWLLDLSSNYHNSNRWWGSSFEAASVSTLDGYVYLDGVGTQLIKCRFEAGGTINENWIVIDPSADYCSIDDCYGIRDQRITGLGDGTKINGRDEVIFSSFSGGQATSPTVSYFQRRSNDNAIPNARFWEIFVTSAASGGLEIGTKVATGTNLNCVALGSIVDKGAGTETYACIQTHTSAADKEPGVSANWDDYWLLLPSGNEDIGASTWSNAAVSYTAPSTMFKINAAGQIWTNQVVADASAPPANVVGKIEIFNASGASAGFIPVYASI